jgi:hypothetical protein
LTLSGSKWEERLAPEERKGAYIDNSFPPDLPVALLRELREAANEVLGLESAGGPSGQEGPTGEEQQTAPDTQARDEEAANACCLIGEVWHIRYEEDNEAGDFPDRQDSALRHLARLLAEPHRRFGAEHFYPPPPGTALLPHLGRDASSDDQAMKEYQQKLKRLAEEIKEAADAHDTETAARLREEFEALTQHLDGEKGARKRGHKKRCGTPSPKEKADQALRVGLGRVTERFREKGLPKLADHLDGYICNKGGEWWYAPPPGTSPWHVSRPDPSSGN